MSILNIYVCIYIYIYILLLLLLLLLFRKEIVGLEILVAHEILEHNV